MAERKLRVHTLAKELSVTSKTIIEKCHAEDIEIKNHMHVVTAGLAATIREWFSEGSHDTTLEQSARVDLKKVRVKRKTKAKKEETPTETPAEAETAVAVLEAPVKDDAVPVLTTTPSSDADSAQPDLAAAEIETAAPPAADVPPADAALEAAATAVPETQPVAGAPQEPADDDAPDVPMVPGPQNIPQPAQLKGPRVIRIERADDVTAPRRSPRPPRTGGMPAVGPPDLESRDDRRPRGRGAAHGPATTEDRQKAAGRRSPRRSTRDTRALSSERLREWRDRDLIERRERLDHATGRGIGGLRALEGKQGRRSIGGRPQRAPTHKDKIELVEPFTAKDFSRESGITVAQILRKMMQDHGQFLNPNATFDPESAQLLAVDFGIELTVIAKKTGLDRLAEEFAALDRKKAAPRPPVVAVLGHVDHGKTSLLDKIREAKVAAGEAGGITQHIGAYRVKVGDKWVTFLDTPGHTAFTAMRSRGANLTDVVVLVVAADDGVMPTTIEAITHAKAAEATIVVALNKIDLPHDIDKIYAQLTEQGLTPSGEWGGETDVIKTSAVTGEGIDDLLSHLATLSDVMDLQADPTLPAWGTVIEAKRKEGLGNVAQLLVREGTLKPGQVIVCGPTYGRVRSLRDDSGKTVHKAGPCMPVEVAGLSDVPLAGDPFYVLKNVQEAKDIAEETAAARREASLSRVEKPTNLESFLAQASDGELPELQVIFRADVQGSVDVIRQTLADFPRDRVKLNVLHAGVGTITESDVVLAAASNAIVVGFQVVADSVARKRADNTGVSIKTYRVIYELLADIRKALEEQLPPEEKIEPRGRAEVREVFSISKVGKIAGCFVRDGVIARNHKLRLVRDGVVIKERSTIDTLRRFKDDAKEVKAGFECGVRLAQFDDLKPGDVLESYEVVQVAQTLDD